MPRTILYFAPLVLAFSILTTGCGRKRQADNPAAPAAFANEPGNALEPMPDEVIRADLPGTPKGATKALFDPLERDKDLTALKKPGRWRVRGKDGVNNWEGYLLVEHHADAYLTAGYFDWNTGTQGGRYRFQGTYDPATRKVRWTGFTIEDRVGLVANAHYEATLSEDGRQLLNGSWQGGVSRPGTWTGELEDEL